MNRSSALLAVGFFVACGPEPTTPVEVPETPPQTLKILAPVEGPFRVTRQENPICDNDADPAKWTFCQHKTGLHQPGEGIADADETLAWDMNLLNDGDNCRPIFAVAPGKVVRYGSIHDPGQVSGALLIEHATNGITWWSGYVHLKDIQVAADQEVTTSTFLGRVSNVFDGTRFDSVPNHLHFVAYEGANEPSKLRSRDAEFAERPLPPAISTMRVVQTVPVETYPSAMALSRDASRLYVLNVNPFSSPRRASISVINTNTNTTTSVIILEEGSAEQITVTPETPSAKHALVAVNNRLDIVDLATQQIKSVTTGGFLLNTSDVVVSPKGDSAYVTNRTDDVVSIIEISSAKVVGTVRVGAGNTAQPYGLGITPDGKRLYVANRATATVSVIDIATRSVMATISLSIGSGRGSTQVAINCGGNRAVVTNVTSNQLALIDIKPGSQTFNQEIATVPTGGGNLIDVALSPDGKLALVTATSPTNALLLLDVDPASATFKKILASVVVDSASGIAFNGSPGFAYVTSVRQAGAVSVIELR